MVNGHNGVRLLIFAESQSVVYGMIPVYVIFLGGRGVGVGTTSVKVYWVATKLDTL